jgi:xanthine dehydrogenase/oxidase
MLQVGVDSNGKIEHLKSDIVQDSGHSLNESLTTIKLTAPMANCYLSDTFTVTNEIVRTHTASNTWCRGPGSTEGVAFIEEVMEHIARVTKLDPLQVRLNNMPPLDNPLPAMINDLKATANYDARKANVEAYNAVSLERMKIDVKIFQAKLLKI